MSRQMHKSEAKTFEKQTLPSYLVYAIRNRSLCSSDIFCLCIHTERYSGCAPTACVLTVNRVTLGEKEGLLS